jgi:hypothetical protein
MGKKSREKDEHVAVISSPSIKKKLPNLLHKAYFVYLSVDGEKNTNMFWARFICIELSFWKTSCKL